MKLRKIYLGKEVSNSINLIKKGICELNKSDVDIYENYIPLILLSSGFERLMKCIVCLMYFRANKKFPSIKFLKDKFGHDLEKLKAYIVENCEKMNYGTCPATKNDIEFFTKDEYLDRIVRLLSDFGMGARYYNLDTVANGKSSYREPGEVIGSLEREIINKHPELEKIQKDISKTREFNKKLNQELITILEKFARALSRLFTLGDLGDIAPTMIGHVEDFLFLRDADLGKANYCNQTN